MRNLILLFGLLICFSGTGLAQESINWMSMDEALEAQKEKPKKIMVDAYTDWCGPCKLMDKNTFQNPDVVQYVNKHYYAVKFNAEGQDTIHYNNYTYTNPKYDPSRKGRRNYQHVFARYMKISGYPSIVFFDENGKYISPVVGYRTPQQIEIFLKMVAQDDYKKIKTKEAWVKYEKNFKPKFEAATAHKN